MSRWTAKQREAIEADGMNLLVAAAAGSGKTSVLVERIIRKLLDEKNNIDIDELVVVTFTRAAAGEMRERIAAALNERLRENPTSRRLERQLVLLNAASISTFDSFCQSVVKKNFHQLDIDPKFRIASEPELALIRHDVLEDLFEDNYSEGTADFLAFVDAYANERGDSRIYEMILGLYNFSGSQPQPVLWLNNLVKAFDLPADGTFTGEKWLAIIIGKCRLLVNEGRDIYRELLQMAEASGFDFRLENYRQELGCIDSFERALEEFKPTEAGWEQLRTAVYAIKFERLKSAPKGQTIDEAVKEYLDRLRNKFKAAVKGILEDYFTAAHDEVMADIGKVRPYIAELCRLTLEFGRRFSQVKRQRTIVDFNDMAHYCLAVLCDSYNENMPPEEMRPSAAAQLLRDKYQEIMCDEYQDTNGVQETILRLVSRDNNFFVVGDVKQSIYRFRSADSDLFLEKYTTYTDGGAVDRRVLLAQNFRSRRNVLEGVNFIFRQLMSPEVVELAYSENEQLNVGREFADCETINLDGPIEVKLIDSASSADDSEDAELSGLEAEAAVIGQRINELMSTGTKVMEKDGSYRDLEYRDIVILLRATEGKTEIFNHALKKLNIPVYAPGSNGYFQQLEIKIMLSLLRLIDNPLQDIPLAAVLCSNIGALSSTELARLRLAGGTGSLWSAIQAFLVSSESDDIMLHGRLVKFMSQLAKWRGFAAYHSVPELIWQIFRDTGYYEYTGGLPGGLARQANLRLLYDRAVEYERTNYRGLFRFLRFIERMQRTKTDLAAARTLGENENVVRIMSIHKSKGLEFPVVIVADIGKKFNYQDTYKNILINKKYGLGAKVIDADLEYQYPLISHTAIAYQMRLETKAEELRILYVALTRAREKLILVGRSRNLSRLADSWSDCLHYTSMLLPDYVIAAGNSYLEWLGAALIRHRNGQVLRDYCSDSREFPNCFAADESSWQIDIVSAGAANNISAAGVCDELTQLVRSQAMFSGVSDKTAAVVQSILEYPYDDFKLQNVPAKLSVTEMKRRFAVLEQAGDAVAVVRQQPLRRRPRFVQQKTGPTGSEYGTLVHSVLQYIDYRGSLDEVSLNQQLDMMVQLEKILPKQRSWLNTAMLRNFFSSELGQRMRRSAQVWREMPFSMLLRAQDFYPEVGDSEETIFVQGVIDVLFEEDDGLVLLDYKTDGGSDSSELAEKYRMQINIYASAVSQIMNRPVKEKYLYFFRLGQAVAVK